jgi:dTDP-4-amino-4,6-dideoxygalactose transaminase
VAGKIPVLDLSPQTEALWPELMSALEGVVRSGQFILGPSEKAFEAEAAAYLGAAHAVGVNSGTDALVIALRAAGIGEGDEVITTPFSFFATAESISHLGARPVFVDIDPRTFNLDPARVLDALTERTMAILPAHMFGQTTDMGPLLELAAERGLKIIEDVAQAFGADWQGRKLGTLGAAGCFSFFPTKPLGGFGDGGLVVTDDDEIAATARMLRAHGARKKYYNEVMGYNSRLDEMQAAILRVKLPHVDDWNAARAQVAQRYGELLADIPGIVAPPDAGLGRHVWHQYTIRVLDGRRDAVHEALGAAGVGVMIYYPVAIHQLPAYAGQYAPLPVAEQATREVLSLPIWPEIDAATQMRVAEAVKQCLT